MHVLNIETHAYSRQAQGDDYKYIGKQTTAYKNINI